MASLFIVYVCMILGCGTIPVIYDTVAGIMYLVYLSLFLFLPVKSVLHYDLPPASSIIILSEQVRLCINWISFAQIKIMRVKM